MYLEFLLVLAQGLGAYGLFGDKFNEQQVTYLHTNQTYVREARSMLESLYKENAVQIYCQREEPLSLTNIFQSNQLKLISELPNMKYSQYKAATAMGVHEAHLKGAEFHEGKLLSDPSKRVHYITMPPHTPFCYGIYTEEAYNLSFVQTLCDFNRLSLFLIGLFVWISTTFYSSAGPIYIPFGVVAVVGVDLACWLVVFLRGDYRLRDLYLLGSSLYVVIGQYSTSTILALVVSPFLLAMVYRHFSSLGSSQLILSQRWRLMRFYSYFLILIASSSTTFGWTCVCMLLPWPKLWRLLQWLHVKWIELKRNMWNPSPHRFPTEPDWDQMPEIQTRPEFAKYFSRTHDPNQSSGGGDSNQVNRGNRVHASSMF